MIFSLWFCYKKFGYSPKIYVIFIFLMSYINMLWFLKLNILSNRKEEAVSRPKLEFVPKTLADLHIEGIHDLNHGRRYSSSMRLPSSSLGDIPTADPLRAWESPRHNLHPREFPRHNPHPRPAPRCNGRDPWTGDWRFFCWYIFFLFCCFSL